MAGDSIAASEYEAELAGEGHGPWWRYVAAYQALLAGRVAEARTGFERMEQGEAFGKVVFTL